MEAIVSNIERLATYDGPGLRTVIYFKGCPLRCKWCSNPETLLKKEQVMVNHNSCIACQNCVKTCPNGAISFDGKIKVDFDLCNNCQKCISNCPTGSLKINGKRYTIDELVKLIIQDKTYYQNSNGGLTVSGGEMLMHGEFVIKLFEKMHEHNISTAIETSGYGSSELFKKIINLTDYVIMDYKLPTSLYKKYTGKTNERIKENIKYALNQKQILVRIPIIPGINTSDEIVDELINDLIELEVDNIELLKYHRFGLAKYEALNMEYPIGEELLLDEEQFENIKKKFKLNFENIK